MDRRDSTLASHPEVTPCYLRNWAFGDGRRDGDEFWDRWPLSIQYPPRTLIHLGAHAAAMKVPSDRRVSSDGHYAPYPQHPAAQSYAPPPPALAPSRSPVVPEETDSTQYKVARAISSCTRCRNRKQKCDGKLPACSACEKAKVECIGFDAISKTNISRK